MANPGMMPTLDPTRTSQLTQTGMPGQMSGCPCCQGGPGAPQGLDLQQLINNPNFIKALLDLAQKLQMEQVQPGQQPGQLGPGQQDQTQVPETMMV
jgi:hypothetical protein